MPTISIIMTIHLPCTGHPYNVKSPLKGGRWKHIYISKSCTATLWKCTTTQCHISQLGFAKPNMLAGKKTAETKCPVFKPG